MKFKFEELEYQKKAINSVLDLFEGQETGQSVFTVENNMHQIGIEENLTADGYSVGIGNRLDLTDDELMQNMHNVQLHNGLPQTSEHDNKYPEFDINMETGTGKTYVYLKTIFELKKKYGFSKFIIVVPSVPIKEGVKKSLDVTFEQFKKDYPEIPYSNSSYFVYDSSKPELVRDFAVNQNLSIMVITIAAFNKDKNIINQEDRETGKLIDLIKATKPILIIDEPQLVDNTEKAQDSIKSLNPLMSFRYSATHNRKSNLIYSFDSIDAYEGEYVKQIEVASFSTQDYDNAAYIKVNSIKSTKDTIKAKIEISVLNEQGKVQKKVVEVDKYKRNSLFTLSGGREIYSDYRIKDIYCGTDKYIEFLNGVEISEGDCIGDIDDIDLKRQQIRKTIQEHLDKEKMFAMKNLGVKVLSLFFIDRVDKYRYYDENGNPQKGEYAKIFEEEYKSIISQRKYNDLIYSADKTPVEQVHNGYFAIDKKVVTPYSESTEKNGTKAEESTYNLIMKDKEKLLSLDNKLRFIFSCTALGVGWDNPNVFHICTLAENRKEVDRRQKIGRGLRLCVNQDGERVKGFDVNTLTVVANESYEEFASQLQHEIERDNKDIKFGTLEFHSFANIPVKQPDGTTQYLGEQNSKAIYDYFVSQNYIDSKGKVLNELKLALKNDALNLPEEFKEIKEQIQTIVKKHAGNLNIKDNSKKRTIELKNEVYLDPEFIALWDSIKYKTKYSIEFNTPELVEKCVRAINTKMECDAATIISKTARLKITDAGIDCSKIVDSSISGTIDEVSYYPDIITFLQNKTNLTRKTIVDILINSHTLHIFKKNPQSYMTEVAKIIQRVLRDLILDGIKYTKLGDDYYYAQELLKENPITGYLERNMLETNSNKYPFTHVVYDSDNEASFAEQFENNRHILKYVKLPSQFKVPTPLGPYNPDWAVLVDKNGEKKLYFVLETKRENLQIALDDDLRQNEKDKIYCGRKHFEAIKTDAQFEVVTNFDKFIQGVTKE